MNRFKSFCRTFQKYQKLFGLNRYDIRLEHCAIDSNAGANITINEAQRRATVRLNTNHSGSRDVRLDGKHEAIHLLLARLVERAHDRFTSEEAINQAEEELVTKLEKLIP